MGNLERLRDDPPPKRSKFELHTWFQWKSQLTAQNQSRNSEVSTDIRQKTTELFSNFSTLTMMPWDIILFKFHVHYQPPKTIAQLLLFREISTKNHQKKTQEKKCVQPVWWIELWEPGLQQLFFSQLLQDLRNLAISIHLQDPSSEIDVFSPLGRRWEQVGGIPKSQMAWNWGRIIICQVKILIRLSYS